MNRTYIHYFIETINTKNRIYHINCSNVIIVFQPQRWRDKIFKNGIPFIIMFTSIQMGILLDITVLKELVRRPIQVLIGFICQYFFMPLIAYAISKIFKYPPLYGLGLFVVGCCPGGSASNQWTVIFDGDLNLSVFMSFASTVASFFMMPFWLLTLGQYAYLRELKLRIPFLNLAISLLTIIGPLSIGMVLVYFIPKLKPITERIVKPMLIMLICYFFVFGAFVNYYLFSYIDLITAITASFLPWLGFLLGGFFAWICKQDWKRIMTIGIETGKEKKKALDDCENLLLSRKQ
jgi:sodium/bile acid cotransporter 3/5